MELQRRLPSARVLYVSATGATDANNLCYMRRLGLWGAHTAFKGKHEFVHMLTKRGVSAMELVRALSFVLSDMRLTVCDLCCLSPPRLAKQAPVHGAICTQPWHHSCCMAQVISLSSHENIHRPAYAGQAQASAGA